MRNFDYVYDFENKGFGMFVHFGLYSVVGEGEWYLSANPKADRKKYDDAFYRFKVSKTWAKELVKTAKNAGCKYITLTARHHDGFSLYDTRGLNDFDALHSACGRDLVKEFVDECNAQGLTPFFYHTLLDWYHQEYNGDFSKYIDYLVKSIEILCSHYGKIGGLWFDGMWDKPNEDWQEDRIYATIRKYQPTAMIINNTGLSALGKVGHAELDSVTFERGNPCYVDNSDRPRAGEMCQILNDHWGYAKGDINYKPLKELLENLVDCRKYRCNFLLNVGPMGNGKLRPIDKEIFGLIGDWVTLNDGFIYKAKPCEIKADGADILFDGEYYYAVIKGVGMSADPNVGLQQREKRVALHTDAVMEGAIWLDNKESVKVENNSFLVEPFIYGRSYSMRIVRFSLK